MSEDEESDASSDIAFDGNGDPLIDGCSVETQFLRSSGRARSCEACGFGDWEPGDVKYIIEHWANEDCPHGHGAREHLCPACAVKRGLPASYYRQNKNAPAVDAAAFVKKVAADRKMKSTLRAISGVTCDACGKKASATALPDEGNHRKLLGFVAVQDSAKSSLTCLCLACAQEEHVVNLPERSESAKKRKAA